MRPSKLCWLLMGMLCLQGKGDVLLFPSFSQKSKSEGSIRHRDWLGGLLKYDERKAAFVL
jgi:hypothetical protein